MKKLLTLILLAFAINATSQITEPKINAQTLDGHEASYFLDTLDFAVTTIQHVDAAYAGSITSDGSIKAPFTTIQEGITAASSGDIVLVYPGSYTEHLTITTDSLKIIGYGANQTFLETTVTSGTGIALTDYTTFQGIKFTGDAAGAIIELDANETNVFIKDCIFDITGSNTFGISGGAAGSDSLFVENCTFYTNSGDGAIWLEKTNTNTVIDNNIFYGLDSTSGYAIQTAGIDGARFTNNQIEGFASGIFTHTVTTLSSGTFNVLIEGNTIKDCSKAIRLGHSSMTVDMDSMFVFNNTCYYNSFGIYIENDAQVLSGTFEVTGNTLAENTVNIRNDGTAPAYSANILNGGIQLNGSAMVYGIDMNGGGISTADFRLQSGNTISNPSADDIIFTGRFGSDYYQSLTDIATMDRQHIISGTGKMEGNDPFNTKNQMQGGFFGIQLGEGLAISDIRTLVGSESKATLDRDFSNAASFVVGSYDKVSIRKTAVFAGTAIANKTLLGRDNTATIAQGYNYYAEKSAAGFTSSAIFGSAANTWDYGFDLSAATFNTADFRLQNAATINNIDADTLEFTETVIKLSGVIATNSTLKTITTNQDFVINPNGTGVISVSGTTDYENNVTDDDDIPNLKKVSTLITGEDLDFAGDAGTGDVDLDSQTFTIAGTANEIETAASGQTLTIGLPDDVTIAGDLIVNGGNVKIDGNKQATNLAEFINDDDGALGDSAFYVTALGGGNFSGDVSITGNLDITGALTVAEFTQYISIPSGQATVGGTAPAPTTIGTWRALRFNANAELAFIEFEIPNDWIGTSDMYIKIYGYPTSGDIVQAGEIIEFDAEYRSIAGGEPYDNGTSVTISPTYTQSGVGTDKALIELTVLIDFDNANQPLTKGDVVGIKCFRDVTTSDTYSGDFDVVKWEIQYQANTFPIHQN